MSLYLAVFGKPRYLGLVDIGDRDLSAGRWIVVETLRGMEMALLGGTLSREQEGKYRSACLDETSDEHTKGPEPMLQEVTLIEPASESQLNEHEARRGDEESVLIRARQILGSHQFQMKLVDVEYTMDRKKLFFYFTSEQRVDFRAYVRDLAKEFRIRIEMRQIGVRDEAKTVRGVSPCGRPCCCSYWLHRFTPINIRMVKEQNLALNPTKISGICGRLMCCMFYEHSTYGELWKNLPAPGSKIKTPLGNYVLDGVDLRAEAVRVTLPEGGEAMIPVAEFSAFKEVISRGEAWKKDEEKEEPRRPVSPRGLTPRAPFSSRPARPSAEKSRGGDVSEDFSKNARRLVKPEKISIEEHLAGRVNREQAGLIGQAMQNRQEVRRQGKRKDAPPLRKHEDERAAPAKEHKGPFDQRPRKPGESAGAGKNFHSGDRFNSGDRHTRRPRNRDAGNFGAAERGGA